MTVVLKAGMKLKPPVGSSWEYTYGQVELLSSAELLGRTYWWTKALTPGGSTRMETFIAASLEAWEEVPAFFRMGKKYRYEMYDNYRTYEVVDLYEVDSPATEIDRIAAIIKVTNSEDCEYITVLDASDFKIMKEVE